MNKILRKLDEFDIWFSTHFQTEDGYLKPSGVLVMSSFVFGVPCVFIALIVTLFG